VSGLRQSFFLLCILGCLPVVAHSVCSSVREVDFRNRVYPLNETGFTEGTEWLHVTKGRYEAPHEIPLNLSFLYFDVVDVAFGDLTGDLKEEAAVVALYGSNSGSFHLTDTYIFSCVGAKVKLIGILKQSRIEKETGMLVHESVRHPVTIKNGSLDVKHGTGGARPSPEFITTFRYQIVGNKLIPRGHPISRRPPNNGIHWKAQ